MHSRPLSVADVRGDDRRCRPGGRVGRCRSLEAYLWKTVSLVNWAYHTRRETSDSRFGDGAGHPVTRPMGAPGARSIRAACSSWSVQGRGKGKVGEDFRADDGIAFVRSEAPSIGYGTSPRTVRGGRGSCLFRRLWHLATKRRSFS